MRSVIFSDVHANEAALRTVLADVADARADRLICLGDVLGYGPEPVETLECVYRNVHVCLAGNHDDAVSGRFPTEDFSPEAAAVVVRHRGALTARALDWLRHLPHVCRFTSPDGDPVRGAFACAHGDFTAPEAFCYVTEPAEAAASFAATAEQLLFVGHTHEPGVFILDEGGGISFREPEDFVLEDGKRYLVNVGSVGYPRSGVCRSCYCLYDDLTRTVRFRSVPFDAEGFRVRLNRAGLAETPWVAARVRACRPKEVRRGTAFGKVMSGVRHARRLHPAAGAAYSGVAAPAPVVNEARRTRSTGAWVVVVLALAACVGVWCTRGRMGCAPLGTERAVSGRPARAAAVATPRAAVEQTARPEGVFAARQPLSGGWTVQVEDPAVQKVRIDSFGPERETVFCLSSRTNGVIRFEKELSLSSRPKKVYYTVRMVLPMRLGGWDRFRFLSSVLFYAADGRLISEESHAARRSASNKEVRVPEGAEKACLRVDCTVIGNYHLAVPQFRCEPLPGRTKGKRVRR